MTCRGDRETKGMVDKGEAWDALPATTFWGGVWVSHIPHVCHSLGRHGKQCRFCKVSQYFSKWD